MISAKTARQAAEAAFINANDLCSEAQLLAEHAHTARAAALAVIGLEEFAKGVAYTLAAIYPKQGNEIREGLRDHVVKHWIAETYEGVETEVEGWVDGISWEMGVPPQIEEVLLVSFRRRATSEIVPAKSLARDAAKKDQKFLNDPEIHVEKRERISTTFVKDAALYVDIAGEELLLPNRVSQYANQEVQRLTWSLRRTGPLREILANDKKWGVFAEGVRQSAGTHIRIEEKVMSPKKKASEAIKQLPRAATWNDILSAITRAKEAAADNKSDQNDGLTSLSDIS